MSALPENIPSPVAATPVPAPAATVTAPAAGDESGSRHLFAVHPTEDTTEIPPVPGGPSVDEVAEAAELAKQGGRDRAVAWMREVFIPGSGLYHDRQPSIAEGIRRAKTGSQLATGGPLRVIGKTHGYATAAYKAWSDTKVWIVSHPARLTVFIALMGLAIAFPFTRGLLHLALTPFAWAYQALD